MKLERVCKDAKNVICRLHKNIIKRWNLITNRLTEKKPGWDFSANPYFLNLNKFVLLSKLEWKKFVRFIFYYFIKQVIKISSSNGFKGDWRNFHLVSINIIKIAYQRKKICHKWNSCHLRIKTWKLFFNYASFYIASQNPFHEIALTSLVQIERDFSKFSQLQLK